MDSERTTADSQPVLQTERLTLVPLGEHHLERVIELDSDPQVHRSLFGRGLTREEATAKHGNRLAAARKIPGLGFWAGYEDDAFVGFWILQPPHGPDQPQVPGEADLGYRLMARCWRRGLASEGARELLRYGFDEVQLTRIFAQTLAANTPSRSVMNAIGMSYVRAFPCEEPEPLVPESSLGEVEYAITREQWFAQTHR